MRRLGWTPQRQSFKMKMYAEVLVVVIGVAELVI